MADIQHHHRCLDPALGDLRVAYSFGHLDEPRVSAFETHLLTCVACWHEVTALRPAVQVLYADRRVLTTIEPAEVAGLMGLSAALRRPMAGHSAHAALGAVLYAAMFAIPVLVELAYQWDRYGRLALLCAPPVFAAMLTVTLLALWQLTAAARTGGYGLVRGLACLVGGAAGVVAIVVAVMPVAPTVEAAFKTYPAHLGYLKSAFYAHLVGPAFLVLPFAFVTSMQRELQRKRHQQVLWLIDGDSRAAAPRGVHRVSLGSLLIYLGLLFTFHVVGVSHLFDNLSESPYRTFFMALVMVRVGISLLLPCACVWWFKSSLDDLRRECLAVLSFER
ncbi:hypothetical protein [Luteitalea sp.]|uniref:hypothetical protein n=1 Tax=Luteitalea sp. TaxID=2004800 RepID=UPI0025C61FB9|nr:hypothetical protein [Luteitalea sp.]